MLIFKIVTYGLGAEILSQNELTLADLDIKNMWTMMVLEMNFCKGCIQVMCL